MAAEGARSEKEPSAGPGRRGGDVSTKLTRKQTNPVELDRLIHGRVRLGIVSALAVNDSLSFNELKELLETSDGNLSVHARRLEDAGYLSCSKSFEGRVPHTEYRLTLAGKRALEKYIDHMEALIHRVRES
jgi:DNA-binding HxlR family transcriptional regulator